MKCYNCGREILNDSNFCEYCGKAVLDDIAYYQSMIYSGNELQAAQHYCISRNASWEEGSSVMDSIKRNLHLQEETII